MTENNETPKNNELMNLATSLSAPKPGLVFVCVLVLLNYKFWIIAFGGADAEAKIKLIQTYFAFDFCNLLGKIKEKYFFTNFCANWEVLYNIVLAFIASIFYPAVINVVKLFYEKFTNRAISPDTTIIQLKKEIEGKKEEIKGKNKEIEEVGNSVKRFKSTYEKLIKDIFSDFPTSISNKDFLALCSKIKIYLPRGIFYNKMFPNSINLAQFLFLLYEDVKIRSTLETLGFNDYQYLILGETTINNNLLYQPIQNILLKLERKDFKDLFSQQIKDFAGELESQIKTKENINRLILEINTGIDVTNPLSPLGAFKIMGYFYNPQNLINFQGQLVLAKALHSKIDLLQDLNDKENILKILNNLRENEETLEEMLNRLFTGEKK